jgi:2-methylcitrate dehydratase PrpD
MSETTATRHSTQALASFLAGLRFEDLPDEVVERTEEFFLDWVASALAGKNAKPVQILQRFAEAMGPDDGPSEILTSRRRTSPLFAALVNGAASHVVEQDDVHNGAVFHPATVVFPAVLATAQQAGSSGREVLVASVAGYEAGVRIGAYLGRSHYRVFHTTGTAGTLAAAAAVSRLLGADEETMLQALGSAGTQAAGLWEFLRDAADSKQLHTAKAAADGLLSAYIARDGFTGARRVLEGERGMAAGMSTDVDPAKLVDGLGESWAVLETSFKYHASCRHTHPAADALLQTMQEHQLAADDIERVRARVHAAAIDVLGPVTDPRTIHQSKFSMGFVLALAALRGRAGVNDFTEEALEDEELRAFHDRVEMVLDEEVDAAYPERWIGLVEIVTTGGERFTSRVDVPKGDPGNTLSPQEIEEKARDLAAYRDGASSEELGRIVERVRNLHREPDVRDLLPAR